MQTIDFAFLRSLVTEAGQMALRLREPLLGRVDAEIKADQTPVTVVDRQVEDYLIERISARYPGHVILSEESGLHPSTAGYTWVIDPIDGTRSYATGLPVWGVSIGIIHEGAPYAGAFYLPAMNEYYWSDSITAYRGDRALAPVTGVDLDSVMGFLAIPSEFHRSFCTSYPRARSMGSTAAHLVYAATGAAVGVLMNTSKLWDIAGVLPMLKVAGIALGYLDGQPFDVGPMMKGQAIRAPLLAAHPSVLGTLRSMIWKEN